MNKQQPLYLLAGGRGHSIMVTMMNTRNIILSIGKERPEIAFVGAASLRDNWMIYALISMFIKVGCKCTIRRVLLAPKNADIELAKVQLQKADAVLFSGGDVEVGMQVLREKQILDFCVNRRDSNINFVIYDVFDAFHWYRANRYRCDCKAGEP